MNCEVGGGERIAGYKNCLTTVRSIRPILVRTGVIDIGRKLLVFGDWIFFGVQKESKLISTAVDLRMLRVRG